MFPDQNFICSHGSVLIVNKDSVPFSIQHVINDENQHVFLAIVLDIVESLVKFSN